VETQGFPFGFSTSKQNSKKDISRRRAIRGKFLARGIIKSITGKGACRLIGRGGGPTEGRNLLFPFQKGERPKRVKRESPLQVNVREFDGRGDLRAKKTLGVVVEDEANS